MQLPAFLALFCAPLLAADTASLEASIEVFRGLGVPGAIITLIGYTLRKIVLWATPHIEAIIIAHIQRQKTMGECQEKLTDSTIDHSKKALEMHEKSLTILTALENKIAAGICRANSDAKPH